MDEMQEARRYSERQQEALQHHEHLEISKIHDASDQSIAKELQLVQEGAECQTERDRLLEQYGEFESRQYALLTHHQDLQKEANAYRSRKDQN